jgi:hypothetical protein
MLAIDHQLRAFVAERTRPYLVFNQQQPADAFLSPWMC